VNCAFVSGYADPAGDPILVVWRLRTPKGELCPDFAIGLGDFFAPIRSFRLMETTANWMDEGTCRNLSPTTFFPSDGVGVEVAKRICATCPVIDTCLEYALENHIDHGVWGGTSERQRRRILKARGVRVSVFSG